jgi:hypothetical protein
MSHSRHNHRLPKKKTSVTAEKISVTEQKTSVTEGNTSVMEEKIVEYK